LNFYHNLLKKVVKPENIAFLYWIAIRVRSKIMVFEVPILDLDPPFVKHVTKIMVHPGVNFTNVFRGRFLYERLFLVMFKLEKDVCMKKAREKTLVKLTPEIRSNSFEFRIFDFQMSNLVNFHFLIKFDQI